MIEGKQSFNRGETEFHSQGVVAPAAAARDAGAKRRRRYQLRETAGKLLNGEQVARCGRYAADRPGSGAPEGFVAVRVGAHGAHLGNVTTCKSVWHCPVCAAKIASARREEVRALIEKHEAAGGTVYMATFTMPHHAFQRCETTKEAVSGAFRKVISGKAWVEQRQLLGVVGMIRALELTHGENGWHPHLHVLVLMAGDAPQAAKTLGQFFYGRWARAIERMGFGKTSESAWRFIRCGTPEAAGDYVTKWGPEWELTQGHLKIAKGAGRSPWRILADAAARGEARDIELFKEYGHALKGARQLTWSHGLKLRYDEDVPVDDDTAAKTVAFVHQDFIPQLLASGMIADVLDAAERGGAQAVKILMRNLGALAYVRVVEPLDDPAAGPGGLSDHEALARIFGTPVEFWTNAG